MLSGPSPGGAVGSILLAAGEPSGDRIAAAVASRLRRAAPEIDLVGLGGPVLRDRGVPLLARTDQLGVVGVTEALPVLPAALAAFRAVRRRVREAPPAAALLVGNDVFHAILGRWLRRRGVWSVALFPPQTWLFGALARPLARSYDLILTSFPEEQEVYGRTAVECRYVGHYLCDEVPLRSAEDRASARRQLGLGDAERVVAVLPGSRGYEVRRLGPAMLRAAAGAERAHGPLRVVVAPSDTDHRDRIVRSLAKSGSARSAVVAADGRLALRAADAALLASGTATLEAGLMGVPAVVAYRVSALTWSVVRGAMALGLIRARAMGLPNLVLEEPAVRELHPRRSTAAAMQRGLQEILAGEASDEAAREVARRLRAKLFHGGTFDRVATLLVEGRTARTSRALA